MNENNLPNKSTTNTAQISLNNYMHNVTEIDLTNDDESSERSNNSTESYNFDDIKPEHYNTMFEFDLLANGPLLSEFTNLLDDNEDDVLSQAMNTHLNRNITNECAALAKQRKISQNANATVQNSTEFTAAETSKADKLLNKIEDKQCDKMSIENLNDSFVSIDSFSSTQSKFKENRLSQSLCIGSIMSDHYYLSHQNTLDIVGWGEDKCCHRQAEHESAHTSPKTNEYSDRLLQSPVAGPSNIEHADTGRRGNIQDLPNENAVDSDLKILFTRLSGTTIVTPDNIHLLEEKISKIKEKLVRQNAIECNLNEKTETMKSPAELKDTRNTAEQNGDNDNKKSSEVRQGSPKDDLSSFFSQGHSEPLEYYGTETNRMSVDNSSDETETEEGN